MTKKKSLKQWLNTLETSHNKKIDLGLKRVTQVYNKLNLEKIAPTIITVAGTNGKGSTVAILASICQQAGYNVGDFTSPHIRKYNERIKINSNQIDDKTITKAFELIEQNLDGITLSYFEYSTLAAAIIFKQSQVDIAILEVGLGGRLDSVNAIDTDCAVITTIDIDHTSWLGNTRNAIGFEKAGIMRENKPIIYGGDDCPQSIIDYAQELGAKLIHAKNMDIKIPTLNINGDYQKTNAKTSLTALQQLPELNISEQAIQKGLKSIQLFGRLQKIAKTPEVIIDVSHNQQAANELTNWLTQNPIAGKTIAVFAVLADKEPIHWIQLFENTIDIWNISSMENERAMPKNDLLKILADFTLLITSYNSVNKAFKAAQEIAQQEDRIIVFGSFYTVSEAIAS